MTDNLHTIKIGGRLVGQCSPHHRGLIVTWSSGDKAVPPRATIAMFVELTRGQRDSAKFVARFDLEEARDLLKIIADGVALLESGDRAGVALPRAGGNPPASWAREARAGTSGTGAPVAAPTTGQDAREGGK